MLHEFGHLLTNPAHWAFEGVSDLVFAIPGFLFGRFWLKRHDKAHHEPEVSMAAIQAMFVAQGDLMYSRIARLQDRLKDLEARQ